MHFVAQRHLRLWIAVLAAATLVSCSKKKPVPPSQDKVLVIGLDGAEWNLINPMVQAGQLPNLARLMQQGVYGNLRSLEPLEKSPAIWTTIATGKSPQEHGIYDFVDKLGGRPLTQNIRKVRALWSILSGVGRSVGVVGWLMSWPAEPVNGFVVSDYLQYAAKGSTRINDRTYPPELEQQIDPMVMDWQTVPWSFVQRFLDAPIDTLHMSDDLQRLLLPLKWISAGDVTFARVAEQLYRSERPDFFSVYLRGMDSTGHLYWNYMQPDSASAWRISPLGTKLLKGTQAAYYRFVDQLIGPIVQLADSNTTIVVVSDHGFKGGEGRGIEAHRLDGVLIMAGNHVGKGEITGASVYDVTPTVLALLGLPPAEDMHGKVLWSALDASIPRDRYRRRIATYETGERPSTPGPVASPVDEQLKERLRSLGYID